MNADGVRADDEGVCLPRRTASGSRPTAVRLDGGRHCDLWRLVTWSAFEEAEREGGWRRAAASRACRRRATCSVSGQSRGACGASRALRARIRRRTRVRSTDSLLLAQRKSTLRITFL